MIKSKDLDVREISIRRKFNLGNYESIDIEYLAAVKEGQDFKEVALSLDREATKFFEAREGDD